MSTPAGRSRCISASIVLGEACRMSISRLCVRISKCSRLFLSTCGERLTQNRLISVGNGTGPLTNAPVRVAVSTIRSADWSRTLWSYALRRMRIFCLAMNTLFRVDRGDDAGADRAAALADGETQAFFTRNRRDQLDVHLNVVARHDHLDALGQFDGAGNIGRAEVELRTVVCEKRR